jgi:hypothetical protein
MWKGGVVDRRTWTKGGGRAETSPYYIDIGRRIDLTFLYHVIRHCFDTFSYVDSILVLLCVIL